MQNATPFWSSPLAVALHAIAIAIASAVSALLAHFLTKRRQSADIHKTNAETGKTQAETRQIDSEILLRAFERLEELEEMNRNQGSEIIILERGKAETEWRLSLSEQREKIHIEELRLANAELKLLRKT